MPEIPAIDLVHPMPGFPEHRRFALVQLDDDGVLCELQSLEDSQLRFLVVPPQAFFPSYAPVVADDVVAELEITSVEEVMPLLVVHAGATLESTTANLLAPILVNTRTRKASQVILDDPALSVTTPLVTA